jgi:hypothetical protein
LWEFGSLSPAGTAVSPRLREAATTLAVMRDSVVRTSSEKKKSVADNFGEKKSIFVTANIKQIEL